MRASLQAHRILQEIRRLGLRVSASKTEVTIFSRKPRARANSFSSYSGSGSTISPDCDVDTSKFRVENDTVDIADSFKYLGVFLDKKLTFGTHFEYAMQKTAGVTRALTVLMPNLRGPCESKRKLFANIVLSMLLYGAPV